MATKVEFETTVCGGFPVLVTANVFRGDASVGMDHMIAEDIELRTLRGSPALFLERKLTRNDLDQLEEEALIAYSDYRGGWYD